MVMKMMVIREGNDKMDVDRVERDGVEREGTCSIRDSTDTLSALTLHPGRLSNASTPDVTKEKVQ